MKEDYRRDELLLTIIIIIKSIIIIIVIKVVHSDDDDDGGGGACCWVVAYLTGLDSAHHSRHLRFKMLSWHVELDQFTVSYSVLLPRDSIQLTIHAICVSSW